MTAPAKTLFLLDRALDAMQQREQTNEAHRLLQAAQNRTRLLGYAVQAWQKKLTIDVDPEAATVTDGTVRTEYEGVKLAYRYSDGDRFYVEMPCPRRDEGDGTLEHGDVMVDFYDLAGLGDAVTTIPRDLCWKCQERIENGPADTLPVAPRAWTPLERLGHAIEAVVEDTIRRSIEP